MYKLLSAVTGNYIECPECRLMARFSEIKLDFRLAGIIESTSEQRKLPIPAVENVKESGVDIPVRSYRYEHFLFCNCIILLHIDHIYLALI